MPAPASFTGRDRISRATQSQIGRIAALPIYQRLTIRNWNTTTKLPRMMEGSRENDTSTTARAKLR